jgi:hypothetical protein
LTRQERNRRRRKRRQMIGWSLLGCMLLFLTGVLITYDTMLEVMGLRRSGSIFSFLSTGQALKDIADELPVSEFKEGARKTVLLTQRLLEKILRMITDAFSG